METLARAANRGSVSTGYEIENSLKLERANSEYLSRTPSSNGNQQIFTFSSWVKFSHINSGVSEWSTLFSAGDLTSTGPSFRIGHHTNNSLQVSFYTNSAYTGYYRTDALHRDTAAWYHFVCAIDTTQGTNTNRVKIYVNGEQASTDSVVSHIAQNYDSGVNTGISHRIGHGVNMQTYASEYVSETHFVDGQALAPTDFGEFDEDSGIWKPKAYTGSYGTNGFYLDFADGADLGDDESGNGNDWTENNITSADQATDTPTNNFCTWNPLQNYDGKHLYRDGATTFDLNTNSGSGNSALGSMAFTKGKWYAEFKPKDATTSYPYNVFIGAGVMDQVQLLSTGFIGGKANSTAQGAGYYNANGRIYRSGANVAWGDTYVGDDIISVAFDYRSDGTAHMYVAKNGTWQNSSDPANDTNPITLNGGSAFDDNTFIALGASIYVHDVLTIECNFGGYTPSSISSGASDANGYGTFEYAPPSGYYALCTKNLAEYG